MQLLEYNLTHPYPWSKSFNVITLILVLIVLPILTLVNIVTVGYELVPTLHPTFTPDNTIPSWWNSIRLPPLLRPEQPMCQPKDIGRGDIFRVSPSLFEYRVLSTWRSDESYSQREGKIEYTGGNFDSCYAYSIRFDYNMLDWTQTLTVKLKCPEWPMWAFLETQIVFARDISKDYVGQYYAYETGLLYFFGRSNNNYRKAVFGVLGIIAADSIEIIGGQHLPAPALSFSVGASISTDAGAKPRFSDSYIVYLNGSTTTLSSEDNLGALEIYRDSISNTMNAVQHAVHLDLGNVTDNNIFVNGSAIRQTLTPNLAPRTVNPDCWARKSRSFYHGAIPPPYQTWAEALLGGYPKNISLGLSLAELPSNSTMITNYLCPSYQLKSRSRLISSVFVGTAAMCWSAWATWMFMSGLVARWIEKPCITCVRVSNPSDTTHTCRPKSETTGSPPTDGRESGGATPHSWTERPQRPRSISSRRDSRSHISIAINADLNRNSAVRVDDRTSRAT